MRPISTVLAGLSLLCAGCLDLPLDDWERDNWRPRRASGRQIADDRPRAAREGAEAGAKPDPPTVLVLPGSSTNFTYYEGYYPYRGFGLNGYYGSGWGYGAGYGAGFDYYGGNAGYGYSGYGLGGYGYGAGVPYAGGFLTPGHGFGLQGTARQGGGSRNYPGSGRSYGVGQPRHSSGIYGRGTPRRGGTPPSRFSSYR